MVGVEPRWGLNDHHTHPSTFTSHDLPESSKEYLSKFVRWVPGDFFPGSRGSQQSTTITKAMVVVSALPPSYHVIHRDLIAKRGLDGKLFSVNI